MQNTKIERQWATQLLKEYLNICSARSIQLTPPIFAISCSKKIIGSWDSENKIISISREIILNHSWDVVVEVLKHEMAHQALSEMVDTNEPPHGLAFKLACEKLNVHSDFISASGVIPKFLDKTQPHEINKNKTQQKIKKLLALAESAEEHEASSAMEKANELITRYNIDLSTANNEGDYNYVQIYVANKNVSTWTKMISSIVTDYFFVYAIIISQYKAKDNKTYKAIELIGRKHNLDIAQHVFHFLSDRLEILWQRYKHTNKVNGHDKRSYYYGVLYGFRERLKDGENKRMGKQIIKSTTSELVVAKDNGLQDFIHGRYPSVRRNSGAKLRINQSVYDSGKEDGQNITIYKSIYNQGDKGKQLN
ncbi:MAG: SprT-like domain-containing protein [Desulfotalea sp.]